MEARLLKDQESKKPPHMKTSRGNDQIRRESPCMETSCDNDPTNYVEACKSNTLRPKNLCLTFFCTKNKPRLQATCVLFGQRNLMT